MALRFYNTLGKKKEGFTPLEKGKVGLYTCGPTVYDYAHLGNFRAYVFEDLLRRYLEYKGYRVTQVMNITDVDDKTIKGAKEKGVALAQYTKKYEDAFFEDIKTLNIKKANYYPKATGHIQEMVNLIKRLLEKNYAYTKDGSIYFSVKKFPAYGKLSGVDLSQMKEGERADFDEYQKEDIKDFCLWKKAKEGEPSWETEIGQGRPGWHIECSAMSMKYLGEGFDLHTGGADNIFPHHENEIAQSQAATGKQFVKFWLHCAYLLVNNEKMAKSKGNFYTLRDLLNKGYHPITIRYLLLSTHYRAPLNFNFEGLAQGRATVDRIGDFYSRLNWMTKQGKFKGYNRILSDKVTKTKKDFEESLDDDLNISAALASLFGLIKETNIALEGRNLNKKNIDEVLQTLKEFDKVLGFLGFEGVYRRKKTKEDEETLEIFKLIAQRDEARRKKEFKKADEIRKKLLKKGIVLEDTKEGTRWRASKSAP